MLRGSRLRNGFTVYSTGSPTGVPASSYWMFANTVKEVWSFGRQVNVGAKNRRLSLTSSVCMPLERARPVRR